MDPEETSKYKNAEFLKSEVWCFITDDINGFVEDTKTDLKAAYTKLDEHGFNVCMWTAENCLALTHRIAQIFVMDEFRGPAYNHLSQLQCRIYGPQCIISCFGKLEPLPIRDHPVYSIAMRGLTVSCSNFSREERQEILEKVKFMSGNVSADLTKSTTHLIVGSIGSGKYRIAARLKLPIMLSTWIDEVWKIGKHSEDKFYDEHRCPVFHRLYICVSQLSSEERNKVQALVKNHGGSYSGILTSKHTTHLALLRPEGDKYFRAKSWKIHCVKVDWIFDSIKAGYCKDEASYVFDGSEVLPKVSTPRKSLKVEPKFEADLSKISTVSVSHLEETARQNSTTLQEETDRLDSTILRDHGELLLSKSSLPSDASSSMWDSFDSKILGTNGKFLSSCHIFVTGFNDLNSVQISNMIIRAGGQKYNRYSESITHVICGEKSGEFIDNLKHSLVKPLVVNHKWLIECFHKRKHVDETPYLITKITSTKEVVSLLSEEKENNCISFPEASLQDNQHLKTAEVAVSNVIADNLLNDDNVGAFPGRSSRKSQENISNMEQSSEKKDAQNIENTACEKAEKTCCCDPIGLSDDSHGYTPLFNGMHFVISGFGPKDAGILSALIWERNGTVHDLDLCKSAIKDYLVIVPLLGDTERREEAKIKSVVTNCWLQKCIEYDKLLDHKENPLFKPLVIDHTSKPLHKCVICISRYTGIERDYLKQLAEKFGAVCQEYFVRKASSSRQLLANTHLIIADPVGCKFEAARRWNIPSVRKEWLINAAVRGVLPPVELYSVDERYSSSAAAKELELPPSEANAQRGPKKHALGGENLAVEDSKEQPKDLVAAGPSCSSNIGPQIKHQAWHGKPAELTDNKSSTNDSSPKSAVMGGMPKATTDILPSKHDYPSRKWVLNKPSCSSNISMQIRHQAWREKRAEPTDSKSSASDSSPRSAVEEDVHEAPKNVSPNKYDSPFNKWLRGELSGPYVPDFNQTELLDGWEFSRASTPIEEVFSRNLSIALKMHCGDAEENSDSGHNLKNNSRCDRPLSGVVLCVAKKLASLQSELHRAVASLGGDYQWNYDQSCTHYVFKGKANDVNREFRMAREGGKKIVAPDWVFACRSAQDRVDESLFPHTFNSNINLGTQVLTTKSFYVSEEASTIKETKSQDHASSSSKCSSDSSERNSENQTLTVNHSEVSVSKKSKAKDCAIISNKRRKKPQDEKDLDVSEQLDYLIGEVHSAKEDKSRLTGGSSRFGSSNLRAKWGMPESRSPELKAGCSASEADHELKSNGCTSEYVDPYLRAEGGEPESESSESKVENGAPESESSQLKVECAALETGDPKLNIEFHKKHLGTGTTQSLSVPITWDDTTGLCERAKLCEDVEDQIIPLPSAKNIMCATDPVPACQDDANALEKPHSSKTGTEKIQVKETSSKKQHLNHPHEMNTFDDLNEWCDRQTLHENIGAMNVPSHLTEKVAGSADSIPADQPSASALKEPQSRENGSRLSPNLNLCTVARVTPMMPCVSSPQETVHSVQAITPNAREQRKFMFSGFLDDERKLYSDILLKYGAEISNEKSFDETATHLVIKSVLKNEKFLCSVASGKWILHKSYIEAVERYQTFVPEEEYDWVKVISESEGSYPPQTVELKNCMSKWRSKIRNGEISGAYSGWKVIIFTHKHRYGMYYRSLKAGGAEIVPQNPESDQLFGTTHAFIEAVCIDNVTINIESLMEIGVLCLMPEYFAAYLTHEKVVTENYLFPEARQYMQTNSVPTIMKRQQNLPENDDAKKPRRK